MRLKKDSTEQKLRGAYYTPLKLAKSIVTLFASQNISSILEPSCGDGVFIEALKDTNLLNSVNKLTAVEIETDETEKVMDRYSGFNQIKIYNEDFFNYYNRVFGKERFDLILGNPPYIRYQYLKKDQRELLSQILISNGMKANKLINAWVAFIVACVQLLSKKGKIAFIIPAEILQVAYAEDLRLYLSNNLTKITLITFEKLVFPDIEQEVVVFIGEKGEEEKGIRIIELRDLNDFNKLNLAQNNFQKLQHVKEKWTKYFISPDDMTLIQKLRMDGRFSKFSDYGIINVGITTGNNAYFSITEEVSKHYHLDNVTRPLIGRSSHVHGIYFTEDDWERNRAAGKHARLINFPETPFEEYPDDHKKYISLGEKKGENKGYKCSVRDRWYVVPSVWVPDAFFLRRNNLYPKFVVNKCNAVSTDTMHRLKFNKDVNPDNVLLSYYNSISFAFAEICGRSYGGGVLEILPRELGEIILPKIENIDPDVRNGILEKIDTIIRHDEDIENVLDLVDQVILIKLLKLEPDICKRFRHIWKKMQKRRLGRG